MDYGRVKITCFVFVLSLAVGCCGCNITGNITNNETERAETYETDSEVEEDDTLVVNTLPTEEPISMEENARKEDITMEQILACSDKENLLLEDLLIWNGLEELRQTSESYRQYYYDFFYMGNAYRLEFRSDADNTLLFVRLVDMQTMLNIDIRTGNMEHFINNVVSMKDYIICDLPDKVSCGEYDILKGHFGGINLNIDGELCGSILILDSSRVKPTISDGKIIKVSEYDNNVYHKESKEILYPLVPAILTLMDVEDEEGMTTEYYSVYFAKESCNYCYNIRLRTDLLTQEEVLEILDSVQFTDRAFY